MLSNMRAMADLHQIVDLGASRNVGLADAGAIDAGIGLDFHVVFDDDRHRLRDLVPVAEIVFGESETIPTNDHPILQQNIISQTALLADDRMSVSHEVLADFNVTVDNHVRQQNGVLPDFDIFANYHIWPDVCAFSDSGGTMNHC